MSLFSWYNGSLPSDASSAATGSSEVETDDIATLVIPPARPMSRCKSVGSNAHPSRPTEEQLVASLLCPFCRKIMISERDPLLLECGHSFCKSCVLKMPIFDAKVGQDSCCAGTPLRHGSGDMIKTSVSTMLASLMFGRKSHPETTPTSTAAQHQLHLQEGESFGFVRCLECREKTNLTSEGVADLQVNTILGAAADRLVHKMSICAECENVPTKKYCEECAISLCTPCSNRIHSGLITSQHKVVDLSDIKNLPASTSYAPGCPHHQREESVLYCLTCEELACVLCAYGGHKKHDISLLTDAIGNLKTRLQSKARDVSQHVGQVTDAKAAVHLEGRRVRENSVAAQAFISKKISEIVNVLRDVEAGMLEAVMNEEKEKSAMLLKQFMELESVESDLKLRIQLATTVLKNPNAAETIEPTSRQLKVLDNARKEVPILSLCTSAIIKVDMLKVVEKMNNMVSELQSENFPRSLGNLDVITGGSAGSSTNSLASTESNSSAPNLASSSSASNSSETLSDRRATQKPLVRKARELTPKLDAVVEQPLESDVESEEEATPAPPIKRQKLKESASKTSLRSRSSRLSNEDSIVDLTLDVDSQKLRVRELLKQPTHASSRSNPIHQAPAESRVLAQPSKIRTESSTSVARPEASKVPVKRAEETARKENLKPAAKEEEDEDESHATDSDFDFPAVSWLSQNKKTTMSQPAPSTSAPKIVAPAPDGRFVNFDAIRRNVNVQQ